MKIKSYDAFGAGPTLHDTLEDALTDARQRNVSVVIEMPDGARSNYWSSGEDTGNQEWHLSKE